MGETEKTEWQYASWVSQLGKWAWILVLLNGALEIIFNLYAVVIVLLANASLPPLFQIPLPIWSIWNIIWGLIQMLIAFIIIKPKFSNPCALQDWDALYGWVLKLGSFKLPWMLVWGILFEMFGWYGWGGLAVLIPAIMLLFVGPKPYEWTEE